MYCEARREEFRRLLLANQRKLFAFILPRVPNRHDAEDIMQETVSWMWEHFDRYQEDISFTAWAMQVARFKVLHARQSARRRRLYFRDDVVELFDGQVAAAPEQGDWGIDALRQCLSDMKADDRRLLYLRYEEGLSTRKVAQAVGRPAQGVYRTMARLHQKLYQGVHQRLMLEEACA